MKRCSFTYSAYPIGASHLHTTKMAHVRPLYSVIVEADTEFMNVCLRDTAKFKDDESGSNILISPTLTAFTERCIHDETLSVYKLYALFVWIVIHRNIEQYFKQGEPPEKFDRWLKELRAAFDMHVCGLKPDGSRYTSLQPGNAELLQSSTPYFVHRMIMNYSDM